MTEQELDRIMRRVLIDSLKADEERDGNDQGPSFEPSSGYKRRIRAMLADPLGWLRRRQRPAWRRAVRKAAMIALVCLVAFGGTMAFSHTARAAVVRWVAEWSGNRIEYRYTGEQNAEPLPQYEITELPDGYVETERVASPALVDVVYENSNGEVIGFTYIFMYEGAQSNFTLNDDDVFDVMVDQMNGKFIESRVPGNTNTLAWIDTDRNIHFMIDGCFACEELLHMAESISLCKPLN